MKLVIQIPCLNEEATLPATLADLLAQRPALVATGINELEIIVIDDGSTDRTAAAAIEHGADAVVSLNGRRGLARAFMAGLDEALERGADVIVNTDADNQYDARDLPALVGPIARREADICVGARPIGSTLHFSPAKRALQRAGSWVVRSLSRTNVADAPSGFRALSRDAALRTGVFNRYSYTLETLIQAGRGGLRVMSVPVRTNPPSRDSRLARSSAHYVARQTAAIVSAYLIYAPVTLFSVLAAVCFVPAAVLAARYLWLMALGAGKGHVQSVIVCGVLAVVGTLLLGLGVVAHLQGVNRKLLEELRVHLRRERFTASRTVSDNVMSNRGKVRDFQQGEPFGVTR